jgi:hypothetical protein
VANTKRVFRTESQKKVIEASLCDDHKIKRKQYPNLIRTYFRKEVALRILFSDEKFYDIDGVYNSLNERVWAVDRADTDKRSGIKQRRRFPQKVTVWLGAWSD